MLKLTFVVFACILRIIQGWSTPEDDTYVAAVVEFKFTLDTAQNLRNYVDCIGIAAGQNADMIVFPELSLMGYTGTVQVPFNLTSPANVNPALNPAAHDEIMVQLSKAARDNKIYVLVNVREIANCDASTDCLPFETYKLYNTNVVFDRNGAIIDRYRKINIYEDDGNFSSGSDGHFGMFTTDFGVTFGHAICFDIVFRDPFVKLVQKYKLRNIIHNTMWVSSTPILIASDMQFGFSHELDINMLCAGGNNVTGGSAGSGIYSGKAGPLISLQPTSSMTRILLANVPKVPGKIVPDPNWRQPTPDIPDLYIKPSSLYLTQNTQLMDPGYQKFELKGLSNLTCNFEADLEYMNSSSTHYYRAFAFMGDRQINGNELGNGLCGVTWCSTIDIASCFDFYSMTKDNETIVVKGMKIEMTSVKPEYDPVEETNNALYIPMALKANKYFVPPSEFTSYQYNNEDTATTVFQLKAPQKDLYNFAIVSRVY